MSPTTSSSIGISTWPPSARWTPAVVRMLALSRAAALPDFVSWMSRSEPESRIITAMMMTVIGLRLPGSARITSVNRDTQASASSTMVKGLRNAPAITLKSGGFLPRERTLRPYSSRSSSARSSVMPSGVVPRRS